MSKKVNLLKKTAAMALACTMVAQGAFSSNVITASAAAKKYVTSIKVASSTKTLTVGKKATVKVTVKGTKKV